MQLKNKTTTEKQRVYDMMGSLSISDEEGKTSISSVLTNKKKELIKY